MFAFPEPVIFRAAGEVTDPYSGETVRTDWDSPDDMLTDAAGVEPIASDEPAEDGRQSVIVGYRLYFDHEVEVDRTWRVLVRGELLPVDGSPAVWRSPFTGWSAGTVVQCGRSDG
jgi:hypothetical protein